MVISPALAARVGGDAGGSLKSLIVRKLANRAATAESRYQRRFTVYGRGGEGPSDRCLW